MQPAGRVHARTLSVSIGVAIATACVLAACSANAGDDGSALATSTLMTSTTAGDDPLNTATVRTDATTVPADGAPTSTILTISEVVRTPIPLPPTTTIDPSLLLPTLREGDSGDDVITLQRMLNNVIGSRLAPDGVYGEDTTEAVREFQASVDLRITGEADHTTRMLLTELDDGASTALVSWPVPEIGDGSSLPCEVLVVGDSLMSGGESVVERELAEIGCTATADGVGGRSLSFGWQCRVFDPDGGTTLRLLPEAQPGNESCAPSGLEYLQLASGRQGDIVVVALGTNDSGLYSEARWIENWTRALQLTAPRPVIFLTTAARPGSSQVARQATYSAALDRWCETQPQCRLADWALTTVAADEASYFDSVHLRSAATQARAEFIRDAVGLVLVETPPTTTTTSTTSTTTTSTTTSTTSTTSTTTSTTSTTTTTVAPTTTTSTTTTSTTSPTTTTSTTTSSTTTTVPE